MRSVTPEQLYLIEKYIEQWSLYIIKHNSEKILDEDGRILHLADRTFEAKAFIRENLIKSFKEFDNVDYLQNRIKKLASTFLNNGSYHEFNEYNEHQEFELDENREITLEEELQDLDVYTLSEFMMDLLKDVHHTITLVFSIYPTLRKEVANYLIEQGSKDVLGQYFYIHSLPTLLLKQKQVIEERCLEDRKHLKAGDEKLGFNPRKLLQVKDYKDEIQGLKEELEIGYERPPYYRTGQLRPIRFDMANNNQQYIKRVVDLQKQYQVTTKQLLKVYKVAQLLLVELLKLERFIDYKYLKNTTLLTKDTLEELKELHNRNEGFKSLNLTPYDVIQHKIHTIRKVKNKEVLKQLKYLPTLEKGAKTSLDESCIYMVDFDNIVNEIIDEWVELKEHRYCINWENFYQFKGKLSEEKEIKKSSKDVFKEQITFYQEMSNKILIYFEVFDFKHRKNKEEVELEIPYCYITPYGELTKSEDRMYEEIKRYLLNTLVGCLDMRGFKTEFIDEDCGYFYIRVTKLGLKSKEKLVWGKGTNKDKINIKDIEDVFPEYLEIYGKRFEFDVLPFEED